MDTFHLIRVSTLKEGSNPIQLRIPPERLSIQPYHGCVLSVQGDTAATLDLFKCRSEVYVSGNVNFRAHLVCADCAVEFEQDFSEPVTMEFQNGPPGMIPGLVHELAEQELAQGFYEADEIDLLPLIRDTILLAVPLAPLCRPDCKGICPECGANLNTEECACGVTAGSRTA